MSSLKILIEMRKSPLKPPKYRLILTISSFPIFLILYKSIYAKSNELGLSKDDLYNIVYQKYNKKNWFFKRIRRTKFDKIKVVFIFNKIIKISKEIN